MSEFKRVTPDFAVAAQLEPEDVARAAAEGFQTIIVNRPDGEAPGQPAADAIKAAAERTGRGPKCSAAQPARNPPTGSMPTAIMV